MFIRSPGVPFQGRGLHRVVSARARGSYIIAACPGITCPVLLLFWAWSQNTTEAWMLSLGRRGQGVSTK